jgi:alkanesulfonate monooxygenase SsuD/methylene tetrahydromethanopterin reductase-like flavin-dependent oxidoreductase (luciferase family)
VTYSTTFMHPYHLARLLNSLDHVTGRIAFNVSRRPDARIRHKVLDDTTCHRSGDGATYESAEVCRALWDSVDPDAMVWDRASGIVGDPAKVHAVEHNGRHFKVRGPLNTPPSPQKRPVLIQAGGSGRGLRLLPVRPFRSQRRVRCLESTEIA